MADPTVREQKLVQYLNEAYGKEKQLETTLQTQIGIMQKQTVKKRLQDHLKETKAQSRNLERRIKKLGGKAETSNLPGPDITDAAAGAVANVANRALAAAKGPVQALRGTSPADNQLRNARDAYWNEAEEIAHYNVIEAAAEELGDQETAKLAREHRRQEERMQTFLEKQIPGLVKDVIRAEIPASERKPASGPGSGTRRSSSRSTAKKSSSRSTAKGSSSRSTAKSSSSKSSGSGSRGKSSGSSSRSTSSRSTAKSSSSKSSGSGSRGKSSSSRASTSRSSSRSAPKTASRAKTTGSANGRSASSRSKSSSGGSGSGSSS